ncbi:hypothetical protein HYT24_02980 [Candidatus Pacearchaeota archaeon]|nr:hypothetical protein [Candidatus Pacearchaeota archaeon]
MGMFDFKKKEKVLDLTEDSKKDTIPSKTQELLENLNTEEKKKKLAKRISDMADKIDDLSSQIYHLQQRIEVLEKKTQITRLE